jgi:hypothetical protein
MTFRVLQNDGDGGAPQLLGATLHLFGSRQRLRDDSVNGDSRLLGFLPSLSVRVYLLIHKANKRVWKPTRADSRGP